MIKIEDMISRVIICFLIVLFLFYGFMFIDDQSTVAFAERIGTDPGDVDAAHLLLFANLGWVYVTFAIGFAACLLAPLEQSTVFFRLMLVGSFITAIRQIIIYMGVDGGANPVPMIASILVLSLIHI